MIDPLRISATYRLRVSAHDAAHRAQQLALEQSIEMLATSVTDPNVLDTMVARVDDVTANGDGTHTARLALSTETVGDDAGQLMNMLFGNCSLQPDVELIDVDVPAALARCVGRAESRNCRIAPAHRFVRAPADLHRTETDRFDLGDAGAHV